VRIHDLLLPKIDEADEDSEDRLFFVTDDVSRTVRAAVADGATATAFSGEWAELLVHAYCDRPFTDWNDFSKRSAAAAKQWASGVYSQDRPWHALVRAQAGGAAAIAGFEIFMNEPKWSAVALGDSCIFQIRGERICFVLPPYAADQFGNHPRLISTDAAKNVGLASAYKSESGCYELGDRFVLATDAASEAFLRADQRSNDLRDWLGALAESKDAGRRFVESLRDSHDIQDDDVAIVMIET
jgi:hypothetical protein